MKTTPLSLLATLTLLALALRSEAKLPPDRWGRLTEEERHQMTRAERYVEQSNPKSALAEYELFLQLYPKSEVSSYAQLMFAECTRRNGKINTAINEFRNVLDYFPDSPDAGPAQYSIALCHTQTGDSEKAVKAFESVIERWPTTDFGALARNEAAAIHHKANRMDKWLAHLEYLATGEYTDSQNIRLTATRRLAAHRLFENRFQDALDLLEGRTKKNKNAITSLADVAAESLRIQKAGNSYGEKGTKSANATAEAVAAFIDKKTAEADSEARPALELLTAKILTAVGDKEKALQRLQASLKRHPENERIRLEVAETLRSKADYNAARLAYRELKDQYRADSEIAGTYIDEKNSASAIELYKKMLTKHADRANDIQWALGDILQKSGKYPDAIAAYTASQKEPQALFRISECQGAQKNHDAAVQTLTSVMNFFKSSAPEAHYRIANHQAAKGDKDSAIRTLKNVCKAHLNTSWAGKAHQDLSLIYGIDVTLGGAAKQAE